MELGERTRKWALTLVLIEQIDEVDGTDHGPRCDEDNLPGLFVAEQVVYGSRDHFAAVLDVVAHGRMYGDGLEMETGRSLMGGCWVEVVSCDYIG